MHEKNIIIKTKNGNLDCKIFINNKKLSPNIIFYMDAPAIREELRDMCRKLCLGGYNVILPNLFYRVGTEGNYPFNQADYKKSKEELKKMISTMENTSNLMIVEDTRYIINYIHTNFKNNKIGIVGYCMSGRFVVSVGAEYFNEIKAIASFYGVGIFTKEKDSPHLCAKKITGEVYLAFAEKDIWVSKEEIKNIQNNFKDTNYVCNIEIYPGTDHGFAFPNRNTYKKEAADKHWTKLFELFNRNLKNKKT